MKPAAKPDRLAIEYVSVDSLIPYVNNARTHSPEQVAQISASIKEFGFTNPVLIDGENGLIAGHGRVMAARKLGMKEVPSIQLSHLTEVQKRAYILSDNKLALNAGWDDDLLAAEMTALADMDFDMALIGFCEDEIEKILADEHPAQTPISGGGIEYQEKFSILVECSGEQDQRAKYEALSSLGYICRVLVN
jgi:ParB-like chromosome segregation protein Spo0J